MKPSRFVSGLWILALVACLAGPRAEAEVLLSTRIERLEYSENAGAGLVGRILTDADVAHPGDELRYTITFANTGLAAVPAGVIVITNPLPAGVDYVPGSADGPNTQILIGAASADGGEMAFTARTASADPGWPPAENPAVSGSSAPVAALRWIFDAELAAGEYSQVWFHVRLPPGEAPADAANPVSEGAMPGESLNPAPAN